MSDTETKLIEQLVTANRILANEGIMDVFGHISVRSERDPEQFLLSVSRSPQAVRASDIQRYRRSQRQDSFIRRWATGGLQRRR